MIVLPSASLKYLPISIVFFILNLLLLIFYHDIFLSFTLSQNGIKQV